jgi:hypothetical protein
MLCAQARITHTLTPGRPDAYNTPSPRPHLHCREHSLPRQAAIAIAVTLVTRVIGGVTRRRLLLPLALLGRLLLAFLLLLLLLLA